jgi:uncharacterized protein YecT (DUF1311 family)
MTPRTQLALSAFLATLVTSFLAAEVATAGVAAANASVPPGTVPSGGVSGFVPIVEPFTDKPAIPVKVTANCHTTDLAQACYDGQVENLDAAIDAARQRQYEAADAAGRAFINRDDAAWLAARARICTAAAPLLLEVSAIDVCPVDESAARLAAVSGTLTPVPTVTVPSPSYGVQGLFTTPAGSLVGLEGVTRTPSGAIDARWVVVGGYLGFTVVPGDFPFVDGRFFVAGSPVPGQSGVLDHPVATAHVFAFDLLYHGIDRDTHPTTAAIFAYQPEGATIARFGTRSTDIPGLGGCVAASLPPATEPVLSAAQVSDAIGQAMVAGDAVPGAIATGTGQVRCTWHSPVIRPILVIGVLYTVQLTLSVQVDPSLSGAEAVYRQDITGFGPHAYTSAPGLGSAAAFLPGQDAVSEFLFVRAGRTVITLSLFTPARQDRVMQQLRVLAAAVLARLHAA